MQSPAPAGDSASVVPGVPADPPLISWREICVAYPDQWVGLVDLETNSDAAYDVRRARVVSAGTSPWEVLRALRLFRARHTSAQHLFTGTIRSRR